LSIGSYPQSHKNMNIDVGSNLTSLGFTWLFLHYLLQFIIGIILLAVSVIGGIYLYNKLNVFSPISITKNDFILGLIIAGIIVILIGL